MSTAISAHRCELYAEKAREREQPELADIYESFLGLLREYAEDLSEGRVGRVEIDVVTL